MHAWKYRETVCKERLLVRLWCCEAIQAVHVVCLSSTRGMRFIYTCVVSRLVRDISFHEMVWHGV